VSREGRGGVAMALWCTVVHQGKFGERAMAEILDCPLCGQVVEEGAGRARDYSAGCRLRVYGEPCIVLGDLETARKLLLRKGRDEG
jgi:hypothetical protein